MPNFWHLAHQTPKYEPYEVFHICHFLLNMLQYTLKFESALFTFIIIYIYIFIHDRLTFFSSYLFLSSLCLLISFLDQYLLSLSPPCSTISLLSLLLLHVTASLFDKTQAGASSQADLYGNGFFFFFAFFFFLVFLWFDGGFGWVDHCPPCSAIHHVALSTSHP